MILFLPLAQFSLEHIPTDAVFGNHVIECFISNAELPKCVIYQSIVSYYNASCIFSPIAFTDSLSQESE